MRGSICEKLNLRKVDRTLDILEGPAYRTMDAIFLQEVAASFVGVRCCCCSCRPRSHDGAAAEGAAATATTTATATATTTGAAAAVPEQVLEHEGVPTVLVPSWLSNKMARMRVP